MKTKLLIITVSCTVGASTAIAGDAKATATKPILEIVTWLENDGYGPITDVCMDDGRWEVEAYKEGIPYELTISPETGEIITEHRDDGDPQPPAGSLKLSEILKKLDQAGYSHVDDVSFERHNWEVEAVRNRTARELRVDPKSGEVISDRIDD